MTKIVVEYMKQIYVWGLLFLKYFNNALELGEAALCVTSCQR